MRPHAQGSFRLEFNEAFNIAQLRFPGRRLSGFRSRPFRFLSFRSGFDLEFVNDNAHDSSLHRVHVDQLSGLKHARILDAVGFRDGLPLVPFALAGCQALQCGSGRSLC